MAKCYSEKTFRLSREAYSVLLGLVSERDLRTITYGQLARRLGMDHHRPLCHVLEIIQQACAQRKLPTITVLVVKAQDGKPSTGCTAYEDSDVREEMTAVRGTKWPASAWW